MGRFLKTFLILVLCRCVYVCVRAHTRAHAHTRAKLRGQLIGGSFLLLPHGFLGPNSGSQAWWPTFTSPVLDGLDFLVQRESFSEAGWTTCHLPEATRIS